MGKKQLKKVVVQRRRWLRGEGTASMLLRESDRKMCCLGFVARQSGYRAKDIAGVGDPADVEGAFKKMPRLVLPAGDDYYFSTNTDECQAMMEINDNRRMPDAEREKQLRRKAKSIGYNLVFV